MTEKTYLRVNLTEEQVDVVVDNWQTRPSIRDVVIEVIEQDDGLFAVAVHYMDGDAPALATPGAARAASASLSDALATGKVGKSLEVIAETADSDWTREAIKTAGAEDWPSLGSLSRLEESNGDSAAIGWDKNGGWSYGAYQMSSNMGKMREFIEFLEMNYPEQADYLNNAGGSAAAHRGDSAFKAAWRQLARLSGFRAVEHAFIQNTIYDVAYMKLGARWAIDRRSNALRDVVWSTAVQHGAAGCAKIFNAACDGINPLPEDDADLINRIYAERSKVDVYFRRSEPKVKDSVAKRFTRELKCALAMLVAEKKTG